MKPNPVALLIDAEAPVRRLLRVLLEPHRYRVFDAENGEAGIREAVARRPDVIILDLMLPDGDGLEVLKRLREWNPAPILILSAETAEARKVAALDGGANDYLLKPFGAAELLARLRVLQRLTVNQTEGPFFIAGDLHVDVTAHVATIRGHHVNFTPTEEALFFTLVRYAGHLVTCGHLLRSIWGTDAEAKLHDLHVYIRSLRQKLQGAHEELLIQTEGREGYRLLVPFDASKPLKKVLSTILVNANP